MLDSVGPYFWPLMAALLWGVTNPLLKRYAAGFADTPKSGGALGEIKFLLQRPRYLAVQGLNLVGSAVFFWGLREADVSTASIVANALAFAITIFTSAVVLKEESLPLRGWLGSVMILGGVSICLYSKV